MSELPFRRGGYPPAAKPRPIFLLKRGDVKQPVREVQPGALECLPDLDANLEVDETEGSRRAHLAHAIGEYGPPETPFPLAHPLALAFVPEQQRRNARGMHKVHTERSHVGAQACDRSSAGPE